MADVVLDSPCMYLFSHILFLIPNTLYIQLKVVENFKVKEKETVTD